MYDLSDDYIESLNYKKYSRLIDTAIALDFEGALKYETYFN